MRAERDHHIEGLGDPADLAVQSAEDQADGRGARAIGHDEQHPFGAVVLRRAGAAHDLSHLGRGQTPAGRLPGRWLLASNRVQAMGPEATRGG